jgi:hypothetical protein
MSAAYAVGMPAVMEAATIANIETDFMMFLPIGVHGRVCPAHPDSRARRPPDRDRRDKPGDDEIGCDDF